MAITGGRTRIFCDCIVIPRKGSVYKVSGRYQAEHDVELVGKIHRGEIQILSAMAAKHYVRMKEPRWEEVWKILDEIVADGRDKNILHPEVDY